MNTPEQEFENWYYKEGNMPETTSGDMVHDMAHTSFLAGYKKGKEVVREMTREVMDAHLQKHEKDN